MGGTSNGDSTKNGGQQQWGQGLTQTDLMEKDTVLVLDDHDNVTGSASKKESHVFSMEQPRAILHRAFSVFLFDKSDGRLLLQQRASTKITFPNVRSGLRRHCSHQGLVEVVKERVLYHRYSSVFILSCLCGSLFAL